MQPWLQIGILLYADWAMPGIVSRLQIPRDVAGIIPRILGKDRESWPRLHCIPCPNYDSGIRNMSVESPRFHRRKKRTPPYLIVGAVVFVVLVVVTLLQPQDGASKSDPTSLDSLHLPPFQVASLRWGSLRWDGDDTPYILADRHIDDVLTGGLTQSELIRESQLDVMKNAQTQRDPRLVYTWADAQYRLVNANPSTQVDPRLLQIMDAADPLNVYEYSRLKFLLVLPANRQAHPELAPVGEALMAKRPADEALKVAYLNNIGGGSTLPKALSYAQHWVATDPTSATAHLMLGLLYKAYFDETDSTAYLDKVSAEFHAFLDRAPSRAPSRVWIQQILPRIDQTRLDRHNHDKPLNG